MKTTYLNIPILLRALLFIIFWSIAHVSPAKTLAPGAASINELSAGILQALQNNSFEQLSNFLPTETEVNTLKNRGSEDLKALLEGSAATDLQTKLKADYEALVQQGVSHTLNWTEMTLAESVTGKSSPKNKILTPITLVLTSKQNTRIQVLYEAIKINNRYFLFQRMQLKL